MNESVERTSRGHTTIARAFLLLLLGMLAAATPAWSATTNYGYTTANNASLTDMSTGTFQLLGPDVDDIASAQTNIGFDFYFQGVRHTRFAVNDNGVLRLGGAAQANAPYQPLAQVGLPIITAYGADQRTHLGDGKVHFRVTGSAPSRVLVVEWRNMQSYFASGGTADLTYQVHLHETTGVITFIYGSMSMSALGAGDAGSQDPNIGFSSSNTAGTVGSVTAAQSGTPAPTYDGASATAVANLYAAGTITVLNSAANGSRRIFTFTPVAPAAPTAMSFTGVTTTAMTVNWVDAASESSYEVHVSTDGVSYSLLSTAVQNATSFNATGLSPGRTYFWRVFGIYEVGPSAALAGSQATLVGPSIMSTPAGGNWSDTATWIGGSIPTSADNATIVSGATVTIDTAAVALTVNVATGAILQWQDTTPQTLTVTADVSVASGGIFRSATSGAIVSHVLSVGGDLTNNGTLDFSTNGNTAGAGIVFTGPINSTFGGTGAITDIRSLTINKGTSSAPVLELVSSNFSVQGVTTDVAGFLTLTNGTFKLSGTFGGNNRVFTSAAFAIPVTTGFWLNNPNYVVAGQNGSATVSGLYRLSQGTHNVGTAAGNSLGFNTGSTVTVEGGALNAAGRFGAAAAANVLRYTQSGGTITVCTVGNTSTTLASFDLGNNTTSTIDINGGTVVVQLANTAVSGPRDYRHQASTGVISTTNGTLQLGNAGSGSAKAFNIAGVVPNLVIDNTSAGHSATFLAPAVYNNITRDITINTGTTLNVGNLVFLFNGYALTNNGTLTGNGVSTRFILFRNPAAVLYTGSGTVTAPLSSIELQNTVGLTIDPAVSNIVVGRVILFSGSVTNANKLTLGTGGTSTGIIQIGNTTSPTGDGSFDVPLTFNLGSGGQILNYLRSTNSKTIGPEVNPTRVVTNLAFDDNDPAHTLALAGGDLTVNATLALTNGRLVSGASTLISATAGTVTRTTGYVDGHFRKTFAAISSRTFEVGSSNGYTPVVVNATAGTFPADATVRSIGTTIPGITPPNQAITRHWSVVASAITATLTFTYLDPTDIPVTVTEALLNVYRKEPAGTFTNLGGTITTAANTGSVAGVASFGEFTLAQPAASNLPIADLRIFITDGAANEVPGTSVVYTITAENSGPTPVVGAAVVDIFPASLSGCSWTCAGSGTNPGTCTVSGSGNISDSANLPAPVAAIPGRVVYTATCTSNPSASGLLVNSATISSSTTNDPVPNDNFASDTDNFTPQYDLAIFKTDGNTTEVPGTPVTYTVTATWAAGPSAPPSTLVTDFFPATLGACAWTCVGTNASCAATGIGNIEDTASFTNVGGSAVYTATCSIAATATGNLVNNASIVAGPGDTTPANNSVGDTDMLTPQYDVSISKTDGAASAVPGTPVTYTITATASGPSAAPASLVTDTFPGTLSGCTWTCAGSGATCAASGSNNISDTVNFNSGGGRAVYSATCDIAVGAAGLLANTASVAVGAGDTTPANNTATDTDTLTPQYDVSITKTDGALTEVPGTSVTYTVTATWVAGPSSPASLVTDSFPGTLSGCAWTCAGTSASCAASGVGNIIDTVNFTSVGGTAVYTATCNIGAGATGTLANTATISGGPGDSVPGNNTATDSDTLTPQYDVGITKTDGAAVEVPGTSVTYTITASAVGPSLAAASLVTDTFPGALSGCTWSCAGTNASCTASGSNNISDTVTFSGVGGSAVYTATCNISTNATGTLDNTATVAPGAGDSNNANDSATDSDTLVPAYDVSIAKTDGAASEVPGTAVTYTITALASGPSVAPASLVTDTFPGTLSGCTWTCLGTNASCAASGSNNISDTVSFTAVGGTAIYSATCNIDSGATGTLANTANVAPGPGDTNSANDTATDTDTLIPQYDVGITKTDGSLSEVPGTPVTYTIAATWQTGPSAAPASLVTDTFPAALSGCSWTCSGTNASCSGSGSGNIGDTVTFASVGGTAVYTATCNINPGATGTLDNTATVAPGGGDSNAANNSATDSDSLGGGSADLGISVTDNREFVRVGEALTTLVTVNNGGPSNSPTNTVASTLPTELSGGAWTCIPSGGASCAAGSGNTLGDTPNMPVGGQVIYSWTTTVQPGSPDDAFAVLATVAIGGGASDPVAANDSGSDTPPDIIALFKDGFDGPLTGVLEGFTDATGYAHARLQLDADLLASLAVAPTIIATGERSQGVSLFRVELARFGSDTVLRLVMRNAQGVELPSAWRVVALDRRQLELTWQPASTSAANGYLRVRVEGVEATLSQRPERDGLLRLRVPIFRGNLSLRPAD